MDRFKRAIYGYAAPQPQPPTYYVYTLYDLNTKDGEEEDAGKREREEELDRGHNKTKEKNKKRRRLYTIPNFRVLRYCLLLLVLSKFLYILIKVSTLTYFFACSDSQR